MNVWISAPSQGQLVEVTVCPWLGRAISRLSGQNCLGSVVLEPGEALSFANAPLAAVRTALANDEKSQDRAVAEILRDVDMDAALAELLNGE